MIQKVQSSIKQQEIVFQGATAIVHLNEKYVEAVEGTDTVQPKSESWEYIGVIVENATGYQENALIAIAKKEARTYETSSIIVTISTGETLNGDEISQTRMQRAASSLSEDASILWKDSNNEFVELSKLQLMEAVNKSVEIQTNLWVKYS